jgi:hypothetical protein
MKEPRTIETFFAVAQMIARHELYGVIRSLRIGPEEEMNLISDESVRNYVDCHGSARPQKFCGIPFNVDYRFQGIEVEYVESGIMTDAVVTEACRKLGLPHRAI